MQAVYVGLHYTPACVLLLVSSVDYHKLNRVERMSGHNIFLVIEQDANKWPGIVKFS